MSKASQAAKEKQAKRREINLQCMRIARSDPDYRKRENYKRQERTLQKRQELGLPPPRCYNKRKRVATGLLDSSSQYSDNDSRCSSSTKYFLLSEDGSHCESKPSYVELEKMYNDQRNENEKLTAEIRKLKSSKSQQSSSTDQLSLDKIKIKRILCQLCELRFNSVEELRQHALSLQHHIEKERYLNEVEEQKASCSEELNDIIYDEETEK